MTASEAYVWMPGDAIPIPEYEVNPGLLREAFAQSVAPPDTEVVSITEDSLSALIPPERMPTGFLLVDIDDYVGDLSGSLQALQYAEPIPTRFRTDNHDYGENLFFDDSERITKHALIAYIKQSVAGMRPAPDIDAIRDHLVTLRGQGIYVCFLTASTPASELPTVSNFLGRYFNGACDGIVITSGDYREVDKGAAAVDVIKFVEGYLEDEVPAGTLVVSIDDWPRHSAKIREAVENLGYELPITTIQYAFPSKQPPDGSSFQVDSALGCMELAFGIFRDKLATKEA